MKKYFFSLIALLLYSISTLAESKYLYYVGNDEIKRYIVNIGERQYWAGSGSSLHMETGLVLGNAILCEPELGNYLGVIRIPETIDFDGADYIWEGHDTWHFEPKVLNVTGCALGVFENCRALEKVIFPKSYTVDEQVLDMFGFPTKFRSLGVSFKGCTSLLAVENMDLSWVFARQFEDCASLKEMDLSKASKIEERAFSGCKGLEKITLNGSEINDYAFAECNAINKIIVTGKNPEPFNDNVFTQAVYDQATLVVPKGKANIFKRTNGWKNFYNIIEEGQEQSDVRTEVTGKIYNYWYALDGNPEGLDAVIIDPQAPLEGRQFDEWSTNPYYWFVANKLSFKIDGQTESNVTGWFSFRNDGDFVAKDDGTVLEYNKGGERGEVATLDKSTGKLTLLKNDLTKRLINNRASENVSDALALPLCVRATYQGQEITVENGSFIVYVQRPLNAKAKVINASDYELHAWETDLKDIVTLYDWRGLSWGILKSDMGSRNENGYYYYDVKSIVVTGADRLSDLPNVIQITRFDSGDYSTYYSLGDEKNNFTFLYSPQERIDVSYYTKSFGTFGVEWSSALESHSFNLKIPVTITYGWGTIESEVIIKFRGSSSQEQSTKEINYPAKTFNYTIEKGKGTALNADFTTQQWTQLVLGGLAGMTSSAFGQNYKLDVADDGTAVQYESVKGTASAKPVGTISVNSSYAIQWTMPQKDATYFFARLGEGQKEVKRYIHYSCSDMSKPDLWIALTLQPTIQSDFFCDYTKEGVEMWFLIIDLDKNTCQVGNGEWPTIDQSTRGEVTIPVEAKGYKVIGIGDNAFLDCAELTHIWLNRGLEYIGHNAFKGCKKIRVIKIPDSVREISKDAFDDALERIDVPSGGNYPAIVDNLPGVSVGVYIDEPRTPQTVEAGLEEVVIPAQVISIGDHSFGYCPSIRLMRVEVENPVFDSREQCNAIIRTADNTLLFGCQNTVIPSTVTAVAAYAFEGHSRLATISFPQGVKSIGESAFTGCAALKEVRTFIMQPFAFNDNTFDQATYRTATLYVPYGTKSLYQATQGWKNFLNIVEMDPESETAEPYVVYNDGTLTFYCDNQRSSRQGATYDLNAEYWTKPDWLEHDSEIKKAIFDKSFSSYLPTITAQWFWGCSAMTEIVGLDNLNTSKVTNMWYMFCFCSNLTSLDVSTFNTEQVTDMSGMFAWCDKVTSLDVSNFITVKVTKMNGMFSGCRGLTKLDVSNFNTNKVVDMSMMFSNNQFSSISFGSDFVSFESVNCGGVFYTCPNLTTVNFTGDIPASINSQFFDGVGTADAPVTLDVPEQYKANYQGKFADGMFYGGYFKFQSDGTSELNDGDVFTVKNADGVEMTFKVISAADKTCQLGDGKNACIDTSTSGSFTIPAEANAFRVTSVGSWALYRCTKLDEIVISEGVEKLMSNSIEQCNGVTSIVLPASVISLSTSFGGFSSRLQSIVVAEGNPVYDSRDNCNAIIETSTNILRSGCANTVIPSSVTAIGDWSMSNKNLTSVSIPNGVKSIGEGALRYNYFKSVVIPESVERISNGAFSYSYSLESVTILSKNCKIENTAFGSCSKLKTIVSYIENPESIKGTTFYNSYDSSTKEYILDDDVVLYVPFGTKAIYEQTDGWKNFKIIVEMEGSEPTETKPYVVYNDFTLTFYCDDKRSSRQGTVYNLNEGENEPGWVLDNNNRNVEKVVFDASFAKARPTSTFQWFFYCDYLTEIKGIENLNTSEVINMRAMFGFCNHLKSVDVTHFDTRKVENIAAMFSGCTSLESIDLSHFDTDNVYAMLSMFNNCQSLTELDLSNFNTSKANYLLYLFNGCSNLRTLYLGSGFTSTNSVECEDAFAGCQRLNKVVFTGDIPASINSEFFKGVGTADSPAKLDVPEQFEANYAAKFNGNMFYGGYFTLQEAIVPNEDDGGKDYADGNGEIDETTDLNGNVIGNVYYSIAPDNGGYNAAEGCLVVTKPSSDADFDYDNPFGGEFKNMYTGIVIMVQPGTGMVKVEAETSGDMTLMVKVGNNSPIQMSFQNRSTLTIPYSVNRPSYIFIYAGGTSKTRAAIEGALKIYSISWENSASGITDLVNDGQPFDVYSIKGTLVMKGAKSLNSLKKGVYIINGRKVVK